MTEKKENKTNQVAEDEIDLIALAKTIWEARKFIIRTVILFTCFGLAIAILSPKEYTASTTMVPQVSDNTSKMGGLSSLAAMAGFKMDMTNANSELSPYIYPQIVQSIPFQLDLMNSPIRFEGIEQPISLLEYYTTHYKPDALSTIKKFTIGLPRVILGLLKSSPNDTLSQNDNNKSNHLIMLSANQARVREILAKNLTLKMNDKEGYITLQSIFHEKNIAAEITYEAQKLLQQYITDYKIEKATAQFSFIESRYNERKNEFEKAQVELAAFRDKNRNVTSARAQTQEERLHSEYQLAFEVYSELAQQLEQARIRIKEDTPVFSVIKPVVIPLAKSAPNRPLILVLWIFLGMTIGVGWVLGKQFLTYFKQNKE